MVVKKFCRAAMVAPTLRETSLLRGDRSCFKVGKQVAFHARDVSAAKQLKLSWVLGMAQAR